MALQKPSTKPKGRKGHTNNPDGRPPGSKTRVPAIIRKLKDHETSLDFLRLTYQGSRVPMAFRVTAASAAAPYEHKKKPIAIEGTDKPIPVVNMTDLARLSEEELAGLSKALAVIGLNAIDEDKDAG